MLPASRAAMVPVFMATPTSAWARAGRVVGAVAAHGDELALRLLVADQLQLVLRRRLGEEVVDAGLGRDRRGGHRVVARDHDGADAHAAQLAEALADAALDDVLEMDDAQQAAVAGHGQRRAAVLGDRFGDDADLPDLVGVPPAAAAPAPCPSSWRTRGRVDVGDDRRRRRPCGSTSRRRRRRSCASGR